GKIVNLNVLESVAESTGLMIDFGGGVKTLTDAKSVFNAGASIVSVGSMAVKNPSLIKEWILEFGPEKILIGADVLDDEIKISGWLEDSGVDIFIFLKRMLDIGVETIFCTDISKDGMMGGPSLILYREIMRRFPALNLIASGGVSTKEDLVLLNEAGCKGAIVGKAFYEGAISLEELSMLNQTTKQ